GRCARAGHAHVPAQGIRAHRDALWARVPFIPTTAEERTRILRALYDSERRSRRLSHVATRGLARRVPGRKPRADVDAAATQAEGVLRSRHRSRDRAAGSDPGRHGASLSAPPAGT